MTWLMFLPPCMRRCILGARVFSFFLPSDAVSVFLYPPVPSFFCLAPDLGRYPWTCVHRLTPWFHHVGTWPM